MNARRRALVATATGAFSALVSRLGDAWGNPRASTSSADLPADLVPGAHGSDFQLHTVGTSPSAIALGATATSGSSLVVFQFGDTTKIRAPTDNKGNTFALLGSSGYHAGAWAPFGMRMYGKAGAAGGPWHTVSMVKDGATDESTLIAVEVRGGGTIQVSSVVARSPAGAGKPYSSGAVATTGPALLLALWGGDGDVNVADQRAAPEKGWTILESRFLPRTAYIQAALAWKRVDAAGSHTCAWTPVQNQGAILAMVALQA